MILSAQTIRKMSIERHSKDGLVYPFRERFVTEGRSGGLSCCGYDLRIAETIWVWPLWGRLASVIEHVNLPSNVCAKIENKSTNARKFIHVPNTRAEPGWRGYLTVELTRHRPWPVRIRAGTPIAQVVFETLDEPTESPYSGKYQDQGPVPTGPIAEKMA